MPELRRDPITGRSVIVASGRAKRPRPQHDNSDQNRKDAEPCPFCPGNEALTPPEVWSLREPGTRADRPGWSVRAVPNKYPALEPRGAAAARQEGIYRSQDGLGAHEVIIESPEHRTDVGAFDAARWGEVIRAYRARLAALAGDPRWRYVLLYKNQGERAGATLEHAHAQAIAMAEAPAAILEELSRAKTSRDSAGRCVYCAMIEDELAGGARLVTASANFVALCPFAPRFEYETWILPRHHSAAFEQITDEEGSELAGFLQNFFLRLHRVLGRPPLNYVILTQPPRQAAGGYFHWRMEILPQLNRAAGFEWGSGLWMNSLAPEEAARSLRDAL